jgi:hypothetical protein
MGNIYVWVDNIKMDFRELVWSCKDRIGLSQYRDRWGALVIAVIHLRVQ